MDNVHPPQPFPSSVVGLTHNTLLAPSTMSIENLQLKLTRSWGLPFQITSRVHQALGSAQWTLDSRKPRLQKLWRHCGDGGIG